MNCYFEKKDSNDNYDIIPFDKVVKIEYSSSDKYITIHVCRDIYKRLEYDKETKADVNKQVDNYKRWLNITLSPKSDLISF